MSFFIAIDSALSNSISIFDGNNKNVETVTVGTSRPAADLIKSVETAISKNKIELTKLNAIAVNVGPGSFTGIRVGIAFAKGFARPLNLPTAPVNSFEALGSRYEISSGDLILINAGGGYYYCYDKLSTGKDWSLLHWDKLPPLLGQQRKIVLHGRQIESIHKYLQNEHPAVEVIIANKPLAENVAKISIKKYERGEHIPYDQLSPLYIKPSYVEI